MAVFLAASDETDQGHHRSMFWHAGFLAPIKDWINYFTPAWQEDVLNSFPPIPYVHVSEMKDPEWREKYSLSDSQVHDKLDAAGHVIDTMGSLVPLGVKANAGIFLDLFRNYKMRKSETEKAKRFLIDHLCFHSYSFVVLTYVAQMFPEAEKVDFLVDRKDGVFDKQKELYESLYNVLPALGNPELINLLGEILPGGDDRVPLQAADWLCWHSGRSKTLKGRDAARYYKTAHRPGFMHDYPDEDLRKLAEAFKRGPMNKEFEKFDGTMRKLISVPHSEIKAALDAEKAEKASKKKKRKAKKPSASGHADGGED